MSLFSVRRLGVFLLVAVFARYVVGRLLSGRVHERVARNQHATSLQQHRTTT